MDGTNKSDVLTGTADADVINAGNGADTVSGGDGNDILHGDNGNDTLDGGLGADFVYGDRGDDTLIYFVEADALGNDVYDGGQGSDTLVINLNNMALPDSYADSAALKQAITDYFNSHVGQTMDFSSFNIHLTATNLEHLVLQGDAVAPPTPIDVLMRAWIDIDGNHEFGTGDIEIARIEDTNGDHVISAGDAGTGKVGDQIVLGAYPTTIDSGLPSAAYGTPNPQTINEVILSNLGIVIVNTQEGYGFEFAHFLSGSVLSESIMITDVNDLELQTMLDSSTSSDLLVHDVVRALAGFNSLIPTAASGLDLTADGNASFLDISFM